MLNGALTYSNPWSAVKIAAKITVIIREIQAWYFDPHTIEWWAHVTDAPDDNNKIVFKRGIFQGSNVVIKAGGQTPPIAGLGLKLEWKNAQKNAKKNIISETINRSIPIFKPVWTDFVCCPSTVASRITSRHQQNIMNKIMKKPNWSKNKPPLYPCMYKTPPDVSIKAENADIIGQGLGSTKWKLCFWLFLIIAINYNYIWEYIN